jgi:hypothetical protein
MERFGDSFDPASVRAGICGSAIFCANRESRRTLIQLRGTSDCEIWSERKSLGDAARR